MGQFYKGTEATFLDDKMYKAPYELMGQVIAKKDAEVEKAAKAKDELAAMLQANGLKADEARLQEIIGGYTNQVGDISSGIYGDAMNAATYMPKIEELKRKINTDWKMGEVSKIEGNLAAYNADIADWKAKQKANPEIYTDEYIDTLAKQSLAKYKGINYKDVNDYQTYTGEAATAMPDMNKWVDEKLKGAIPDMESITKEKETGKWLVKTKNETKTMSERDLNEILQKSFQGDVNLQEALKQRSKFGMEGFQGLLNEKGEFNPTIAFQATKQGEVPMFANNLLGNSFKAGLEKYGFTETTNEQTLNADPFALKDYDYALAKKKEKEDTEFVSAVDHNTMSTYTGKDSVEFNALRDQSKKDMTTVGEKAMTIALKQYSTVDRPINTPEDLKRWMPTVYKQITSGKFSAINTPAMKELQTQYNNLKFEDDIRTNTLESWKKQHKGPVNWKDPKTVQDWNNWVKDHGTTVAETKVGWGYLTKADGTQLNAKQVDHVISQAGELMGDATFNLPKGTFVTVGGKKYDLSNYHSANAIINAGLGKVQQVNAGQKQTTTSKGTPIPGAFTVVLGDGKQTINFGMNAKSIQPVFGASDSGKVELQSNFVLNGKTYTSRLPELSSETLDDYNSRNSKTMKGMKMITKVGKSSVELPNSGGVIYHGGAGDKDLLKGATNYDPNIEYNAGWLEVPNGKGGYEIKRMEDPNIKKQVYDMLAE